MGYMCKTLSVFNRFRTVTKLFIPASVMCSLLWSESLTISRSREPTKVVIDSPEIRRMVKDEERKQAEIDAFYRTPHSEEEVRKRHFEMGAHPERFPPGHKEFLDSMANAPSMVVPGKTRAKLIEKSKARCMLQGFFTITFIRVVLSGKPPLGGTEVWLCRETSALPFESP